jgi:hypothetical protein
MTRVALFACCALAAPAAQAAILIGNYPQANDLSGSMNLTLLHRKAMGFSMPNQSYVLNSITARINKHPGSSQFFTLYSDAVGQPGTMLLSTFPSGAVSNGLQDLTTTPTSTFILQANTKYWLVIHPLSGDFDWMASSPGITPTGPATHFGSLSTNDAGATWNSSSVLNTYQINATAVPEPASLLALGLGALAASRRRRSR